MGSDYDEMTNDELRDELESRDLPTSGNKDELVQRLESDDAAGEANVSEASATRPAAVQANADELTAAVVEEREEADDGRPPVAATVVNPSYEEDEDGYVGVDPIYRNAANDTDRPHTPDEDEDEG